MLKRTALVVVCLSCAACSSVRSGLPLGQASYALIPAETANTAPGEYLIGPMDAVSVSVFREPQLSVADVQVDSGGAIVLPLIGKIQAAGVSTAELSDNVRLELARYVKRPQVFTSVTSNSQTIAVEGSVNQPGIFPIRGTSSLIEALAMAKSTTNVAAQDEVIVFRQINGQRVAARFDMRRIRMGLDPDPQIQPGDRIVVGTDGMKEGYLDFFSKIPFLSFRPF